ncbi:hypothetical protein Tco_0084632, partial [Tanacetum coccineum]
GRIIGIKSLLNAASITAALIDVNDTQSKLVLLENFNENYSKCLRLLYKVNAAEGVNAASKEVSTDELVSTAYGTKLSAVSELVLLEKLCLEELAVRHVLIGRQWWGISGLGVDAIWGGWVLAVERWLEHESFEGVATVSEEGVGVMKVWVGLGDIVEWLGCLEGGWWCVFRGWHGRGDGVLLLWFKYDLRREMEMGEG